MPMVLLRCLLAWEPKKNAVPSPCDSSLHASRAYRIPTAAALEAVVMGKPRVKPNYRRRVLRLPDLDHCKTAVLNSLVKGVKQLGFRSGNWLSAEQSSEVLKRAGGDTMRAKRDYAMLAMLFGCGFRRSELLGLELDDIQMRQGHWAVVDLIGKGGHIRTVPIPNWVKAALDQWTRAAGVSDGKIFRAVARLGKVWGKGISQNVVWYVVKTCCERVGLEHIAPHDLRRTCAKLCHSSGGELEQIQFLLGHASVPDDRTLSRLQTESRTSGKQSLSPQNGRAA